MSILPPVQHGRQSLEQFSNGLTSPQPFHLQHNPVLSSHVPKETK
jgi:hypothetical protein